MRRHARHLQPLLHPDEQPCDLYNGIEYTWNYAGLPTTDQFHSNKSLQPAPRFTVHPYVKTHLAYCRRKGTSKKPRADDYKTLYGIQEAPSDWWGHAFLKDTEDWWPNKDYDWLDQTDESREELAKLGWNYHTWTQPRTFPYPVWGKTWDQLSDQQRTVLADVFVYDQPTWDEVTREDVSDATLVKEAIGDFEPNLSSDHCPVKEGKETDHTVRHWYPRAPENKDRSLHSFVYEPPTRPADNKKRVLMIASVPKSETRLVTLWSQLECFTEAVDHVIVTAPTWGKSYVEHVIQLARKYIPHFVGKQVTIESKYFVNNRYDVGLWCDAYNALAPGSYDEYGMINDSVLALRRFSAIFDNLDHKKAAMASINFSYTTKWNKDFGPHNWYALSIFRAFTNPGVETFKDYSCVPEDDPKFCPEMDDNKACIINNFEIDLIDAYPCDQVTALYPADSMGNLVREDPTKRIWIKDVRYWRLLVDHMGFPILKSNESEQFGEQFILRENIHFWKSNPLMKACTSLLLDHLDEFFDPNALPSFATAKTYPKRGWDELPPDLRELAGTALGFDAETWNAKHRPPGLAGKQWDDLADSEREALVVLECTRLNFDKNRCFS